jgi:N-carbamoyl-L-amino-acid hydrolase
MSDLFDDLWSALQPIGRDSSSGGYRRFAWTAEDATLREWFAATSYGLGLDVVVDRAGNQWAWWGDPDAAVASGRPGVVTGSHLDSVPDGGAYDGPLGVLSSLAAVDALKHNGFSPTRPIGVVNFADEEGARFGVACAGSRLLTGAMKPDRALALIDGDATSMGAAMHAAGHDIAHLGRDDEAMSRIGMFVELHVEQGRGLVDCDRPVGIGSSIWPHGRWRFDLLGEANHAGTTRMSHRHDPMLTLAAVIETAQRSAIAHDAVATIGKLKIEPNGVNAIASRVTAWLDARGPETSSVRAIVDAVTSAAGIAGVEESFTAETLLDAALVARLGVLLDDAPLFGTGAGHDAGVLAAAGVPAAMLFVRNPTGVSHSPVEHADRDDCLGGVTALTAVLEDLAQ